jgi:hypothetical protein
MNNSINKRTISNKSEKAGYMKKMTILSLLTFIFLSQANLFCDFIAIEPPAKGAPMLKGCICANNIERLPSFHIYYQGEWVQSDKDGFFSFPLDDDEEQTEYGILLCKTFEPQYKGPNTIKQLLCNAPKKFFILKKNVRNHQWQIEEQTELPNTNAIPKNCVIASIKPSLFERLEQWSFPSTAQFVMLPKILLKDDITEENIKRSRSITRAAIKSELNALDTKIFHRKKEILRDTPKEKETVTVSLTA